MARAGKYRLTVRNGPKVSREKLGSLEEAVAALEQHAKAIRSQGPLQPKKLLREFSAADQVAGRVEISTGTFLRPGKDVGIDVMGDGRYVAFSGGMRRSEINFGEGSPFEAVRRALRG